MSSTLRSSRPKGTDGSDHGFRHRVDERYQKAAGLMATIMSFLLPLNYVLTVALALWAVVLYKAHSMPTSPPLDVYLPALSAALLAAGGVKLRSLPKRREETLKVVRPLYQAALATGAMQAAFHVGLLCMGQPRTATLTAYVLWRHGATGAGVAVVVDAVQHALVLLGLLHAAYLSHTLTALAGTALKR